MVVFLLLFRDFLVFVLLFTCEVARRPYQLNVLDFTLYFCKFGGVKGRRLVELSYLVSGIAQVSV